MTRTTGRSDNRSRKSKNQETQLSQQERTSIESASEAPSRENEKNIETLDSPQDTTKKIQNDKTIPNAFLTKMVQRIMNRLCELYGYSIKGDVCRRIVQAAQSYASRKNINIQDSIQEINILELYDSILSILSRGQVPSPLDNTYNDILIAAIVEKYKV